MEKLKGKVAVITGGGGGIGRALVEAFAREGSHVAVADIREEALQETASRASVYGIKVTTHVVDVSDREQVKRFADSVVEEHGQVDMLINNAGVLLSQSLDEVDYDEFDWIVNINVWGVINCARAFLAHLKARPQANIANLSSILGLIGSPTMPAYSMTKFAVRGFTDSLRLELMGSPVHVSCVYPGGVRETNIITNAHIHHDITDGSTKPSNSEEAARFNDVYGISTPEDVASAILRGIKKNKEKILVGRDARFIDLVSRLLPLSYPRFVGYYYTYLGANKNGKTPAPANA